MQLVYETIKQHQQETIRANEQNADYDLRYQVQTYCGEQRNQRTTVIEVDEKLSILICLGGNSRDKKKIT